MAREYLKAERKRLGYTQRQMAEKIHISATYYQMIENGVRTGDYSIWDALEDITNVHQRILRADGDRVTNHKKPQADRKLL